MLKTATILTLFNLLLVLLFQQFGACIASEDSKAQICNGLSGYERVVCEKGYR